RAGAAAGRASRPPAGGGPRRVPPPRRADPESYADELYTRQRERMPRVENREPIEPVEGDAEVEGAGGYDRLARMRHALVRGTGGQLQNVGSIAEINDDKAYWSAGAGPLLRSLR